MRRVVVTGMGLVSPVGCGVPTAWSSLVAGRSAIGPITRFDPAGFKVKVAAEVKDFDPLDYMDKSEKRKNDRCTQFAVAASDEAMAQSGLAGRIDPTRFGVYVGSGIGGIETTIAEAEKLAGGSHRLSPFVIPMMIANMPAGVVAIRHHAQGPTLPVVTACATSSHTIGEACRAIRHGYADAILAGGTEACIIPFAVLGFTSCMALTTCEDPAVACVPFDARRSGFVMGEGAAMLVLEEYGHAVARGADILAEVCGYGNTADAHHITAPDPTAAGITRAIRDAVAESGRTVGPGTYVNAHGTSTPLNDKTETLAFKQAFGNAAYQVAVSSTKSMTGHTLGAAGAMEAIACIQTLRTGVCPPTAGYAQKDPDCDLDYTPGAAAHRPFDLAVSTSLGFGGHNACLVFAKV